MRFRLALVCALLAAPVLSGTAAAGAAGSAGWDVQLAPLPDGVAASTDTTSSVSCAGNALCMLVVSAARGDDGARVNVADHLHGARLDTEQLANGALTAVSCTTPKLCFASGKQAGDVLFETYQDSAWKARGYPGRPPPGLTLTADGCGAARCLAVGYYEEFDGRHVAYVVDRDNATGRLTGQQPILPAARPAKTRAATSYDTLQPLFSPTCVPGGACYALGYDSNGFSFGAPYLLYRSGTDYRAVHLPVPNGVNPGDLTMGAMSCAAARNCATITTYVDSSATHQYLVAEVLRDGVLEADPIPIPRASTTLNDPLQPRAIDCPTVHTCVGVVGFRNSTAEHGALLIRYDGTRWTSRLAPAPAGARDANAVDLTGAACSSATSCVATGSYLRAVGSVLRSRPLVETLSGGTWTAGAPSLPPDLPAARSDVTLGDVSCARSACLAEGRYAVSGIGARVGPIAAVTTAVSR